MKGSGSEEPDPFRAAADSIRKGTGKLRLCAANRFPLLRMIPSCSCRRQWVLSGATISELCASLVAKCHADDRQGQGCLCIFRSSREPIMLLTSAKQ